MLLALTMLSNNEHIFAHAHNRKRIIPTEKGENAGDITTVREESMHAFLYTWHHLMSKSGMLASKHEVLWLTF